MGLISEIEDKETLDAMLLDDSRTAVSREKGFRAMLNQLLGSKGTGDTTASSSVKAPSAKALRERRERLRGF
ncbi:hypothetical protein MASR2M78_32050 [Treponema sp.]